MKDKFLRLLEKIIAFFVRSKPEEKEKQRTFDKDTEEWEFIPGFNKRYKISTHGRVVSLIGSKPRILKYSKYTDNFGHLQVDLAKNKGKGSTRRSVMRLMAKVFLGQEPGQCEIATALDGDLNNTHISNITMKNLRQTNKQKGKTLPIGVFKRKNGKFVSQFAFRGKVVYVGTFDNPEKAAKQRQIKMDKYEKEYNDKRRTTGDIPDLR